VVFTKDDMISIPANTNVSGTIASNINSADQRFYLEFSLKRRYEDVDEKWDSDEHFTGNTFDFNIPTGLPVNFYPVVEIDMTGTGGNGFHFPQRNFVLPSAGGVFQLKVEDRPVLISPPDKATGIDTNTVFSFSSGLNNGIYRIEIDNGYTYDLYTTQTSFDLKFLNKCGIDLSNKYLSWTVYCRGYNSGGLDYYLNPDSPDIDFLNMGCGSEWSFWTKYFFFGFQIKT
jgi:hypothetical protein